MGLIDIIKPLSTPQNNAVNKSQQYQGKNSWEHRESNWGLLGETQVCYPCATQPPPPSTRYMALYRLKCTWLRLPDLLLGSKLIHFWQYSALLCSTLLCSTFELSPKIVQVIQ